jgi:hypothetical protein
MQGLINITGPAFLWKAHSIKNEMSGHDKDLVSRKDAKPQRNEILDLNQKQIELLSVLAS